MFIFFYRVVDLHFFTVLLTRISPIPQMSNILFQRNPRNQRPNKSDDNLIFCNRSHNFISPDPEGVITIIAAGGGRRPKPVVKFTKDLQPRRG